VGWRSRAGMWGDTSTNHRYNLTFSVFARNLFNIVNLAPPVGNLSSPFFGQSTAIAGGSFFSQSANRRIVFQVMFSSDRRWRCSPRESRPVTLWRSAALEICLIPTTI